MLIVGGRTLAFQKSVTAAKAAYEATRKHAANAEEKIEKTALKDPTTRNEHLKSKIGSYEDYAQTHSNLNPQEYDRIRQQPVPEKPNPKTKPNAPTIIPIPQLRKKPAPETEHQEKGGGKTGGNKKGTPRNKGKERSSSKGSVKTAKKGVAYKTTYGPKGEKMG